ncbi:hypothetical protein SAMN04490244_102177 [Tranquillimonas rosea]|uniref:Uncharacterized protein n=1 Tax=Tranquillimonas rosea TaxID=641238 RepID=A0A1H9R943_9RHOB|nr:hypothetical protein [Tranquillimonas rosea]SER69246.1 hypothetical protein SAMN04490244_102177 [Tranquillimonas rosea]
MEWLSANSAGLNVIINVVMLFVWVGYLQVFLMNFLRQRQSMLLINRGAGEGEHARCFVSNMGAEPIYVVNVIAKISSGGEELTANIVDRYEVSSDDLSTPTKGTTQGPLQSGEFLDMGSFRDILVRAASRLHGNVDEMQIDKLDLTVVAASGHTAHLVGGRRCFFLGWVDGSRTFVPERATTDQKSGFFERRKLRAQMDEERQDEVDRLLSKSEQESC